MAGLNEVVHQEVNGYVGKGLNGYSYLIANAEHTAWSVVFVVQIDGKRLVRTGLIVRLYDDQVVIEYDTNDPPLVDALVQAGIPRKQIILAYAGEPVPETGSISG